MTTEKDNVSLYSSDEDFFLDLEKLNVLENPYTPWRSLVGHKSHGDAIEEGELHYVTEIGDSFTPPLRLSRSSIEKVLHVAVRLNPGIQDLTDKLLKQARDEFFRRLDAPDSKTESGGDSHNT